MLTFSSKYKSDDGWKFSDHNRCIERLKGDHSAAYRWILADIEPVFEGIHCWRVNAKHKEEGGWVVYGVSPIKQFKNSCGQQGVWGITYNNCWYPTMNRNINRSVVTNCEHFHQKNLDVDIYLDATRGEMKICVVGMKGDKYEPIFKGMP
eukprot:77770_1